MGWPWVRELVGFIIIFRCLLTQQNLVNRKHPIKICQVPGTDETGDSETGGSPVSASMTQCDPHSTYEATHSHFGGERLETNVGQLCRSNRGTTSNMGINGWTQLLSTLEHPLADEKSRKTDRSRGTGAVCRESGATSSAIQLTIAAFEA